MASSDSEDFHSHHSESISVDGSDKSAFTTPPALTHTLKHDKTILSLIVSSSYIFAGTEGGELLVSCN